MSHIALYRKYRPQTFDDIVGQDKLVKVLKAQIKSKEIFHSYLFAGSRGTGKTSSARIFAHAIGAEDHDIHEIDAASHRGIDDAREIRDSVHTLPYNSPYKVYIIDEVHMLTKEAFNALLKTLEEPPEFVVFILATTELHKVPETIISRCQSFNFERPGRQVLRDALLHVAESEKYTLDEPSADLIARSANGSFRDAFGALEKVMILAKKGKITYQEVSDIIGAPSADLLTGFLTAWKARDVGVGFEIMNQVRNSGMNVALFAELLLDLVRGILIARSAPSKKDEILAEHSQSEQTFIAEELKNTQQPLTSKHLQELLMMQDRLASLPDPSLAFELLLIESGEVR